MLRFKFDDKVLTYLEYYIKYYGTIDLSAEIYSNERLIGKINAEFFNSLSKEFKQFIIDNDLDFDFDLKDQEEVFFNFLMKFKPSYKGIIEEIYKDFNESKTNVNDNGDFDNFISFKSILIIKNIEINIQIDRNEVIKRYIESINYIFSFNDFYALDLQNKGDKKSIEEISNILDTKNIRELKCALDKCNNTDEILNSALRNYCKKNNIEYIDKREKGGCIWIVGGKELEKQMNLLREYNVIFKFSEKGGRASKHRQAWYFK
ncbi:hypothetical protein [Clostridium sp.]|uniref:hypothetical protein n=1 Tax=Clostridium sp. TaxID=1506 RepID=UPI00290ED526|nr:hypothetical protein [Clostridium sp.]MDU5105864.1 hypothetical protein [Clostridium sp.]